MNRVSIPCLEAEREAALRLFRGRRWAGLCLSEDAGKR